MNYFLELINNYVKPEINEQHRFTNVWGCAVHETGSTDKECSCRSYWSTFDEVSQASLREDHNPRNCPTCTPNCDNEL